MRIPPGGRARGQPSKAARSTITSRGRDLLADDSYDEKSGAQVPGNFDQDSPARSGARRLCAPPVDQALTPTGSGHAPPPPEVQADALATGEAREVRVTPLWRGGSSFSLATFSATSWTARPRTTRQERTPPTKGENAGRARPRSGRRPRGITASPLHGPVQPGSRLKTCPPAIPTSISACRSAVATRRSHSYTLSAGAETTTPSNIVMTNHVQAGIGT